jgi:hypothetical protein
MGINWSAFFDMSELPMLEILGVGAAAAIVWEIVDRIVKLSKSHVFSTSSQIPEK